jgi:hypothetical protein
MFFVALFLFLLVFFTIRIGAYDSVKSFYQESTGIHGGAGLMAVRVAAGNDKKNCTVSLPTTFQSFNQ